jgi:hypothetical protein
MTDSLWPEDPRADDPQNQPLDDPIAALLADLWTVPQVRKAELPGTEELAELLNSDEATQPLDTEATIPDSDVSPLAKLSDSIPGGVSDTERADGKQPISRRSQISGYSRKRFIVAAAALAVLAVILVWFGTRVILDSSDGRIVSAESDRTKPGFEAVVEKTPTALVLVTSEDGQLDSATLLALTSEGAGGVMAIPVQTNVYVAPAPGRVVPTTLQALFASSGPDVARVSLGELLNLNFTDTVILKASELQALVAPVAPLAISSPSAVTVGGDELFAKGSIDVAADDVWSYLSTRSENGSELDRALRQQSFWKAWLAAIGTSGTDVSIPVPTSNGIGRFLAALSRDQLTVDTLPVTDLPGTDEVPVQYRLAPGLTGASVIAPIVPFPDGSPGRRPRLKVLDGTGELSNAQGPATLLAAGGGQVDIIGNATSFGADITEIVYFDPAQLDAANRMRAVLGIGEVIESKQTNSALDITVTIGADYQTSSPTTSTGGPGA